MEPYSDTDLPEDDLKMKLTRLRSIPRASVLEGLLASFSPSERLLLYALAILLGLSTVAFLAGLNGAVSVVVPAEGGSLTEGIVGSARFINPVFTLSQADEDLAELVYSGLTRVAPDGSVVPDLAERYDISPDGTTYRFTLRKDAVFQDGTPVTAADVLFTVAAAQNPEIKSTHRADWEGVTASSPDPRTVVFKLPHAYAPFIENTTLGILPKHLWENISAEEFPFSPLNTHPVGSGPYRVVHFDTDSTGAATRYDLSPFDAFTLGKAYLKRITFVIYPNNDTLVKAFNAGSVDAIAGASPEELPSLKRDAGLIRVPLPRVFGVFFNQSHAPALSDPVVREALNAAIDKQALVNNVLQGFGATLDGPIPPGVLGDVEPSKTIGSTALNPGLASSTTETARADAARAILTRGGWTFDSASRLWKKNTSSKGGKAGSSSAKGALSLSFTLATADSPELKQTANELVRAWRAAGIEVNVHVYPISELNVNVIRPRAYDAVLFGEVVGRTLDLFAFWHSSQRNDPGLNLALYANARADALLAQARATTDPKEREKLYASFAATIAKDQPAVFLYAPEFIYVVPKNLHGIELGALTTPSERFFNVYQWYTETERVWEFFTNKTE